MKKTYQMLITILSLIIILTFTGSASSEDSCTIQWWTEESSYQECWMTPSQFPSIPFPFWDCDSRTYDKSGSALTMETSKTQAATLELFLTIMYDNPEGFSSSDCYYYDNSVSFEDVLQRVCLDGTWRYIYNVRTASYSSSLDAIGGWDVICPDADIDGIPDASDADTIYGTISGDVQGGISVDIYVYSCGAPQSVATLKTGLDGYYAIGNNENGLYGIVPQRDGYNFTPKYLFPQIPQTEIQSYDFTATKLTCDDGDGFLDNGDGTVTDCRTDLIWLKNANCYGQQDWLIAVSYAEELNSGECELSDGSVEGEWRLPTIEELQGIGTDPPVTWPLGLPPVTWTIPGSPFVSVWHRYWSSTEFDTNLAWYVFMLNGNASFGTHNNYFYVWPVRSAD
jgi:hypothetical protein